MSDNEIPKIEEILHTPISKLVETCNEQLIASIWTIGINQGIEIGKRQAWEAINKALKE